MKPESHPPDSQVVMPLDGSKSLVGTAEKLISTACSSLSESDRITNTNLMLRSAPEERVSKHGRAHPVCCSSFETPRFARSLRIKWYPYAKCFEIKRATRSAWVLATS